MAGNLGDLLRKAGLQSAPEPATPAAAPAPAAPTALAPLPGRLVIRFQRKGQGGKTVTVVAGLLADHEAWLGRLKTELGVGGRVEGAEILLQGDQVERVARWFESHGVKKVQR